MARKRKLTAAEEKEERARQLLGGGTNLLADLKAQVAAGEITEDEMERRLQAAEQARDLGIY